MNKHENTHPVIFPGMVISGVEIQSAINAKRIRALMRRQNGLFGDFPDRGGIAGIESLFYCLSLDSDQLAATYGLPLEGWDEEVEKFALSLPDGGIEEFVSVFKLEEEAIADSSVEPDDAGKVEGVAKMEELPRLPSLPSSPRESNLAYLTQNRKASPSSISSNTSTRPESATA